ncbi:WXG100-like domain-containing protein [Nonomuraea sp. NPDC002799]
MWLDGVPIHEAVRPWIGWAVGMDWPEGDETALFQLADDLALAFRRISEGVTGDGRLAGGAAAGSERGDWDGEALRSFLKRVEHGTGGRREELLKRLAGLALACNDLGVQLQYTKRMIKLSVLLLIVQLLWLLWAMLSPASGVAWAAAGARAQVTRKTIRQLAKRLLFNIGFFSLLMGGMDLYVQATQSRRDEIDWEQAGWAALSGALTGALLTVTTGLLPPKSILALMGHSAVAGGGATLATQLLSGQPIDWTAVAKGTSAGGLGGADAHWASWNPGAARHAEPGAPGPGLRGDPTAPPPDPASAAHPPRDPHGAGPRAEGPDTSLASAPPRAGDPSVRSDGTLHLRTDPRPEPPAGQGHISLETPRLRGAESGPRPEGTSRPEHTSRPEGSSRPEGTRRPESGGRPEGGGRPESAHRSDGSGRTEDAHRSDPAVRREDGGQTTRPRDAAPSVRDPRLDYAAPDPRLPVRDPRLDYAVSNPADAAGPGPRAAQAPDAHTTSGPDATRPTSELEGSGTRPSSEHAGTGPAAPRNRIDQLINRPPDQPTLVLTGRPAADAPAALHDAAPAALHDAAPAARHDAAPAALHDAAGSYGGHHGAPDVQAPPHPAHRPPPPGLMDAVARLGENSGVPLGGGVSARRVRIFDFDGGEWVLKEVKTKKEADAEVAGSILGERLGANVPPIYRVDDTTVVMPYVGTGMVMIGMTPPSGLAAKLLGLLHVLDIDADANFRNIVMDEHGEPWGIDMSAAFTELPLSARGRMAHVTNSPFADHWVSRKWNGIIPVDFAFIPNALTRADVARLSAQIQSARPYFEGLGRPDWFNGVWERWSEIAKNARGTRSIFEEE